MPTLFEQLGGDAAVDAAVDRFYEIVLADERINRFFVDIDMSRLATHQKLFLKYAFGGLPSFPGRSLRGAHERLVHKQGLADEHFDAVLEDLRQALRDLGAPEAQISEGVAIAESTRDDVLNRGAT